MEVAKSFRRCFPAEHQFTLAVTAKKFAEEWADSHTPEQIAARIDELHAAGVTDCKPWELFSTPTSPEVETKHRTLEEQEFFDLHKHYPEQPDAECAVCQTAT